MKKILLLLIGFCVSLYTQSQNLTIDELIKLKNMTTAGQINNYMLAKEGWTLLQVESLESITYAYNKSSYSDRAVAFLIFYMESGTFGKKIKLQVFSKEKYNTLIRQIKEKGFKNSGFSLPLDNGIYDMYEGSQTSIYTGVSVSESDDYLSGSKTIYNIELDTKQAKTIRQATKPTNTDNDNIYNTPTTTPTIVKDATYYNELGDEKYNNNDYQGAIADYTEAIRIKPDFAGAYFYRGNAKAVLQDYKGAIADYTEAIRIKPDYADAYFNRGNAKTNLQDYEGAIADYTEAIRINPDYADAYYNRGDAKVSITRLSGCYC